MRLISFGQAPFFVWWEDAACLKEEERTFPLTYKYFCKKN